MTLDCPRCGRHVPVGAVVVHRDVDDGFALYEFRCPTCDGYGAGRDPSLISVLLDAGVRQLRLVRTDEPDPAADVERLRQVLEADDWLDRLTAAEGWPRSSLRPTGASS